MVKNSPSGTEAMNAGLLLSKKAQEGSSLKRTEKTLHENNVKDSVSTAQMKKGGQSPSVCPS